ncbi:Ni/Fe hydrogenase subunit alpha [Candidatus Woesearchaeota archaeon]|nr:Ni/Fe hydrogenase subunit alpha [Candidatus Woesearchaeota archaeon]
MKTIKLNQVTKIEGHAKLHIIVDNGIIKKASLKKWDDLPHITSRICGICSPVHAITSVRAVEDAFNVKVSKQSRLLRELVLIGGTLQSHVLHLYFLTLPDYIGYNNALEMLPKYKPEIERALRIKKMGNMLVDFLGGRDIHPIAVVPGGLSRIPEQKVVNDLLKHLNLIKKDAKATVELFTSLKYPEMSHKKLLAALSGGHYFDSNKIIMCDDKQCYPSRDYEQHFNEFFQKGSTAEFVQIDGKSYMVGALARMVNNFNALSGFSQKLVKKHLIDKTSPYMNNVAQAIEIYEGILRCVHILENLQLKNEKLKPINVRPAVGIGAAEAPRGILFHKYSFDKKGICVSANITTPTSQNLLNIQEAIKQRLPAILKYSEEEIKLEIEKLIRAYDPCISCSTHFLEMKLEKNDE